MKNNPYYSIRRSLVYSVMLVAIFMTLVVAQGLHPDFNKSVEIATIEQSLVVKSLQICDQKEINWSTTPGFVSGKIYDLNINCATFDPNKPGARIWLVEFSSVEARDYALRNFETSRRHIGSAIDWSRGPLIILVDGNQNREVINALKEAVAKIGIGK
jgi:hypothetical protein